MSPREGAAVTAEVTALTPGAPQDRDILGFWGCFSAQATGARTERGQVKSGEGLKYTFLSASSSSCGRGGTAAVWGDFGEKIKRNFGFFFTVRVVKGGRGMSHPWKYPRKRLFVMRRVRTGTGCPEKLRLPHPWKNSGPGWARL